VSLILTDVDDVHRTQIRCFLCTTTEIIRHNSLCPVAAETVFFDNFRERIAGILAKDFRADIPARPTADTSPPVDTYVHFCNSYCIDIPVAGRNLKGNEKGAVFFLLTGIRSVKKFQHPEH
jgi:hypothetical protein